VSERLTDAEIEAIEQRAQKATPAPWEIGGTGDDAFSVWTRGPLSSQDRHLFDSAKRFNVDDEEEQRANIVFAAHAREDVPALVRDLKEAREALRKYGDHYRGCQAHDGLLPCTCGLRRVLGLEP